MAPALYTLDYIYYRRREGKTEVAHHGNSDPKWAHPYTTLLSLA